jgi:hypothetical protein
VAAHGDGYTVFLERTTPAARAKLAELPCAEVRGESAVLLVSAEEDAEARARAVAQAVA